MLNKRCKDIVGFTLGESNFMVALFLHMAFTLAWPSLAWPTLPYPTLTYPTLPLICIIKICERGIDTLPKE